MILSGKRFVMTRSQSAGSSVLLTGFYSAQAASAWGRIQPQVSDLSHKAQQGISNCGVLIL